MVIGERYVVGNKEMFQGDLKRMGIALCSHNFEESNINFRPVAL